MTRGEAIEILTGEIQCEGYEDDPDLLDAHKLGIEALELINRYSDYLAHIGAIPLPSESKQ